MSDRQEFAAAKQARLDAAEDKARNERKDAARAAWVMLGFGVLFIVGGVYAEVPLAAAGGAGAIALTLFSQRWFWILTCMLTALTLAVTALACIIHFMIFGAVAALIGLFMVLVILSAITQD